MSTEIEQVETEEVIDTQDVSDYDAEYAKAWDDGEDDSSDSEDVVEAEDDNDYQNQSQEEELEQSTEAVDEPADENSNDVEPEIAEVLKWKGKELPVTKDELIALAQKGFDATKKWQEVSEVRPFHEIIKASNLTVEQVQMLSDIVKGKNPEALALLAEQSGIDIFDAERKSYTPKVEAQDYEFKDLIAEINSDADVAQKMSGIFEDIPLEAKNLLSSKPDVLRALHIDVKNGVAEKIMPELIKQLAINPSADFVTTYQAIGKKVLANVGTKEEPSAPVKAPVDNKQKKKVAVPSNAPSQKKADLVNDYDAAWDNDDNFNAVMARLGRHNRA